MAKKHSKSSVEPKKQTAVTPQVLVPDYLSKFHCIGSDCEDSCCIGWDVYVDRITWRRYQSCQHKTLARLFAGEVVRLDSNNVEAFAIIKKLSDGRCPFLQQDMLCIIQKELGVEALSNVCTKFPRYYNFFGEQRECGLGVSCPEAARLVLLHPEPLNFIMDELDTNRFKPDNANFRVLINPENSAFLTEFRALILRILQFRELTLGARIMTLGLLLHEANIVVTEPNLKSISKIGSVLSYVSAMLTNSAAIESEFNRIPSDLPRKLQISTSFLADNLHKAEPRFKECLLAFIDGLTGGGVPNLEGGANQMFENYQHGYANYYLPYFSNKGYILENFLANEVFINLFPFVRGNYLDQYRAMVFDLTIIQVILVGMSAHFKGLTDALVVQFIQSFSRQSRHNNSYIDKLTETLSSNEARSFTEVMWMLKEF